jgi:hypothetical protein
LPDDPTIETAKILALAAARHALGLLQSSEISSIARDTLRRGVYSPELDEISRDRSPVMSEVGPRFESALRQLKIQIPERGRAVWVVLRDLLEQIATHRTAPRVALSELVRVHRRAPGSEKEAVLGESHGLADLIGCHYSYDEIDDRGDEVSFKGLFGDDARRALDEEVTRLAAGWIEGHPDASLGC